jgi:transcriptional regulator with XRE-family HTH domain
VIENHITASDVILTEVTITKGLTYMRDRAKLKQRELADMLGVERSTIAKWESGAAFPRASQLPELAKALDCTIDELYQPPEESA